MESKNFNLTNVHGHVTDSDNSDVNDDAISFSAQHNVEVNTIQLHSTGINNNEPLANETLCTVDEASITRSDENISREISEPSPVSIQSDRGRETMATNNGINTNTQASSVTLEALYSLMSNVSEQLSDLKMSHNTTNTKLANLEVSHNTTNTKLANLEISHNMTNTKLSNMEIGFQQQFSSVNTQFENIHRHFDQHLNKLTNEIDQKIEDKVIKTVNSVYNVLANDLEKKLSDLTNKQEQELSEIVETHNQTQTVQKEIHENVQAIQLNLTRVQSACEEIPDQVNKVNEEVGFLKQETRRINADIIKINETLGNGNVNESITDRETKLFEKLGNEIKVAEDRIRKEIAGRLNVSNDLPTSSNRQRDTYSPVPDYDVNNAEHHAPSPAYVHAPAQANNGYSPNAVLQQAVEEPSTSNRNEYSGTNQNNGNGYHFNGSGQNPHSWHPYATRPNNGTWNYGNRRNSAPQRREDRRYSTDYGPRRYGNDRNHVNDWSGPRDERRHTNENYNSYSNRNDRPRRNSDGRSQKNVARSGPETNWRQNNHSVHFVEVTDSTEATPLSPPVNNNRS
ncbi:GATA zinc finger domain-containing protein 14-like [Schistocerca piceifrons]|uniref:GATA zinc finger domain-containing protein 14-like n=1 Tax=Schistocerca piceifrons TaxID=274613 RepID=UPI001F5F984E|nr:GATA zinc finger domain-containing protein 14-like [Schistocerca piceifrons]